MAKRIYLKEGGLDGSGPVPSGYKQIGYEGATFSEKSGLTSSTIGGGSGGGLISLTYVDAQTHITNSTLVPGTYYKITDKGDKGIILLAVSSNKFSLEGKGIFLNPDFQNVVLPGSLYNSVGVWHSGLVGLVAEASVAFWGGLEYINLTGVVGTQPYIDGVNWILINKSVNPELYVEEVDFIIYDFVNDKLVRRNDKRGNSVPGYSDAWGQDISLLFQWGNNSIVLNQLDNSSMLDCINSRANAIGDNKLIGYGTMIIGNDFTGSAEANLIDNQQSDITFGAGSYNVFGCTFGKLNTGITLNPNIYHNTKEISKFGSTFEANLSMTASFGGGVLTIPTSLNYVGIFTLIGSSGSNISNIIDLPTTHKSKFYAEVGNIQNFVHLSISGASNNDLVSDAAVTNTITGRTNGSDFIEYERSGNLNIMCNKSIYV